MENKKQSSIEWFDRWFRDNPEATHEEGNAALQQAKAMHKEEMFEYIKQKYCIGQMSLEFHTLEFEQYYNEHYGK